MKMSTYAMRHEHTRNASIMFLTPGDALNASKSMLHVSPSSFAEWVI